MPTEPGPDTLETIDPDALARVAGGLTTSDQITAALSQITSSLSGLSAPSQNDSSQLLLLMMLMGGGGGFAGGAAPIAGGYMPAPASGASAPVIIGGAGPGGAGYFGGGAGGGFAGGGFAGGGGCGSGNGW